MPNYSYTTNIPLGSQNPSSSASQFNTNFTSVASLVNVDLYGFNNNFGGTHQQVTFSANNVPSGTVSPPVLFTNIQDGAGNTLPNSLSQLFFYSGTPAQGQNNYVSESTGSVLLFGGIILKWGNLVVPGGGSNTFNFPQDFPNNVFSVYTTTRALGAFKSGVGTPSLASVLVYLESAAGPSQTVYVLAIGN